MKYLAGVAAVIIVGIIAATDLGLLRAARLIHEIPLGDKIGHFVLFGLLNLSAIVALRGFRPRSNSTRSALLCSIGVAAAAALEEYGQRYMDARTFSLWDLAASIGGILFFGWLAMGFRPAR